MKKREEMLVITAEECGELIQACSKVIRMRHKLCDIPEKVQQQGTLKSCDLTRMRT